jgi:alcohol dehydrogenase class IV
MSATAIEGGAKREYPQKTKLGSWDCWMYEFNLSCKVVLGKGAVEMVAQEISKLRKEFPSSLLIVTVKERWNIKPIQNIKAKLTQAGCRKVEVFDKVKPNPTKSCLQRGIELCKKSGIEGVVAFGGGSSMDAAKVMAKEAKVDLLVTIPTTAGTGGEISPWAVIRDEKIREKVSSVEKTPDLALLDPVLTTTMPPRITLFTGVDAFSHGLEAYLSKSSNCITDALALQAIQIVSENLPQALENGRSIAVRARMLEGSLLAGIAMLNCGLGLIHAVANSMGGWYHQLPHGWIIAHLFKEVTQFNRAANPAKYQRIEEFIKEVESVSGRVAKRLNIPRIKVREEDVKLLVKRSANNINAATNPRDFTLADIEAIIRNSFQIA